MVSSYLSDLCGDIDESTNYWRDPVKAQQPERQNKTERWEQRKTLTRTVCIILVLINQTLSLWDRQRDSFADEWVSDQWLDGYRMICLPTRTPPACWQGVKSSVPVKVKGRDLCIVSFKIWEVEEVYVCLCISGLSVQQKHTHSEKKETVQEKTLSVSLSVRQSVLQKDRVVLLHGFEQSLSIVWERYEQFELGTSCLLNWKICIKCI